MIASPRILVDQQHQQQQQPKQSQQQQEQQPLLNALLSLEGNVDTIQSGVQSIIRDWQTPTTPSKANSSSAASTTGGGNNQDRAVAGLLQENGALRAQVTSLALQLNQAKVELVITPAVQVQQGLEGPAAATPPSLGLAKIVVAFRNLVSQPRNK